MTGQSCLFGSQQFSAPFSTVTVCPCSVHLPVQTLGASQRPRAWFSGSKHSGASSCLRWDRSRCLSWQVVALTHRTVPLSQVSKTDPSPKREAPTMILFNVVFALRVSLND